MSPIGHLQYGWGLARWGKFSRGERAPIALPGVGLDIDNPSLLAAGNAFHRCHYILFHIAGVMLTALAMAIAVFWRGPRVWVMVAFPFATHLVEDYVTVGWAQFALTPFDSTVINLSHHLPNWSVQGVFQVTEMIFILGATVWISLRRQRKPLEIISPALDHRLVNYRVLPWKNCNTCCGRCGYFHCDRCAEDFCTVHSHVCRDLKVHCGSCAARSTLSLQGTTIVGRAVGGA